MMGTSGAAANVEMTQVQKESHERWKALMWGCANEKTFIFVALFSESTGRAKVCGGVVVVGMDIISSCSGRVATAAIVDQWCGNEEMWIEEKVDI